MSLPTDDMLSLPVIFAWLRVNWGRMVLGGVVLALLAFPVALFKPKSYQSTATLLVFPPTFKDAARPATSRDVKPEEKSIAEMMPRTLPVEAYRAIATSPPLLDEVIRAVPLKDTGVKGLANRLEVELVQMGSRSASTGIMYTQTILFHAKASDPEMAAKIAQTWAEVFKREVDEVAAQGVGETFVLLDDLHKTAKSELEQAEVALAEHQKAWNLELIKAQIEAKRKQITEFEDDLKRTEIELASGEMKVKALEAELAVEPEKRVFFRAPSDDAYWIADLDKDGKARTAPELGLRTEESNPNYVATRNAAVQAKEEVEGLKAKRDAILLKLSELRKELETLGVTFADQTVERDKLTREQESLKANYAVVRAEYEKGRIARQTQASDIVIAGKAVVPDEPSSTSSPVIVLAAAVVGIILTGGLLIMKEISELAPAGGQGGLAAMLAAAGTGPGAEADGGEDDATVEVLASTDGSGAAPAQSAAAGKTKPKRQSG